MLFYVQSPHPWRGIRQRPHHIMRRFAERGHVVQWVEPRYLGWLTGKKREAFLRAVPETPMESLNVAPVTLANGERLPPVRARNKATLAEALRAGDAFAREVRDKRGDDSHEQMENLSVLWLYNPHEEHLVESVSHDLLIYDIMDEYSGFPWSPREVGKEETALLLRSDWTFAGTRALYEAKQDRARGRIECILSGVDTDHFSRENTFFDLDDRYVRIRDAYKRVIGYAGMIDERVDQDTLVRAAWDHRDWAFVLIGPTPCDVSKLKTPRNVFLLGPKPYAELPGYYHSWDVGLLPFVENELTRHINPTKMLEYAAAGVPIVARDLPDISRYYSDGAFLYSEYDGFIEGLRRAANGPDDPVVEERLERARVWCTHRSWDAIAEQMLNRLRDIAVARKLCP